MAVTYRTTSSRHDRDLALAALRAVLGGTVPYKGRMVRAYTTHETVLMDFVDHQGWLSEQSKDKIDAALQGSGATLTWESRGGVGSG